MNYFSYLKTRCACDSQTMEEHDKAKHDGHFDPSTMTCKLREELEADSNDPSEDGDESSDTGHTASSSSSGSGNPNDEYDAVVRKYNGTPLWMKAPNGKPTNLTERQWVQVRTPSFKRWFGDWERNIVAESTENECKGLVSRWRLERKTFKNLVNGRVCELKSDWSKLFSSKAKGQSASYEAHYAAIVAMDRLFEDAIPMWDEDPRNGSDDIEKYTKYGRPFWFNGEMYLAKMTVKEYARKVGIMDGFYSIEAMSVEKMNVAGNNGDISVGGQILDRDVSSMISKLIDGVNGTSKIVDENGEPMVVFHGTSGNHMELSSGYFTDDEKAASLIAEKRGKLVNNRPRVVDGFLAIRNPLAIDATGSNWSDVVYEGNHYLTKDLEGIAKKAGHDGLVVYYVNEGLGVDREINDFVPFSPNQIKSSTRNDGHFSLTSNDIVE